MITGAFSFMPQRQISHPDGGFIAQTRLMKKVPSYAGVQSLARFLSNWLERRTTGWSGELQAGAENCRQVAVLGGRRTQGVEGFVFRIH